MINGEPKYTVEETISPKDKAVIGVFISADTEEIAKHQTYSLGNGKIWVCNEGGNIEIGDYIQSSSTKGHGMKQEDDILHNYTVAKCIEDIDWDSVQETISHNGSTYKKIFVFLYLSLWITYSTKSSAHPSTISELNPF